MPSAHAASASRSASAAYSAGLSGVPKSAVASTNRSAEQAPAPLASHCNKSSRSAGASSGSGWRSGHARFGMPTMPASSLGHRAPSASWSSTAAL